jgi:phosphoribosylformylglycinamidine synthase
MKATVKVRLKNGILDPQGLTVKNALIHLGFKNMKNVRIGKLIELEIENTKSEEAKKIIEDACNKLLSNPVIEDYVYEISEE